MTAQSITESQSFKQVVKGVLELHSFTKQGNDDSVDAESVRDALEAPLRALTPNERDRAQSLSDDLYSVSDLPTTNAQKEMNAQAQLGLSEAFEAKQRGELDHSLKLLRRWKEYISPTLLSYVRGSIWLDAGYPDIAAEFLRHASEGDPANANYRAIYLHAVSQSDPDKANQLASDILADAESYPPVVVARAADIRFARTKSMSDAEAAKLFRQMSPILERNVVRIEGDETAASRMSAYSMTLTLLGSCSEFLGDDGAAIDFYSRGLILDPENDGLLVARGILLYGESPRAIDDLERAARLASPLLWPYLFLAHHYLLTGRYEHCRAMCELGFTKHASDNAKSQLQEWRAITQAELGFPAESVRAAFEAAIRTDPNNESAKRNQIAFEAILKAPHTNTRQKWEQKTEAALRQFGLVETRYLLAA